MLSARTPADSRAFLSASPVTANTDPVPLQVLHSAFDAIIATSRKWHNPRKASNFYLFDRIAGEA